MHLLVRVLMFIVGIIIVLAVLRLFGITAFEVGAGIQEGFRMLGRFFKGLFAGG